MIPLGTQVPERDTPLVLKRFMKDITVAIRGARTNRVTTTDDTVTTLATISLKDSRIYLIEVHVVARRTGGTAGATDDGAAYVIRGAFKLLSGVATQIGSTSVIFTAEDQSAWDATFDTNDKEVRVRVTGAVNNDITWTAHATVLEVNN